jgi:hypothetical protein
MSELGQKQTFWKVFSHPKGGNAPLRHKLALYNYVERQKEQRENIPTVTRRVFSNTSNQVPNHL